MEFQLYMWSGHRRMVLRRHDFYIEQVKARLLSQFADLQAEADRYAEEEFDRIGSLPGSEHFDQGAAAETAYDRAIEFYELLTDLQKSTRLGALSALYHQWDKELRDFVEHELAHYTGNAAEIAWEQKGGSGRLFGILTDFGWDCRSAPFYAKIDACRLIVNVYKHGKGKSLEQLAERYPEYLSPLFGDDLSELKSEHLDHEWLSVSEAQFDEIAGALRAFWTAFPERLFLEVPDREAQPAG